MSPGKNKIQARLLLFASGREALGKSELSLEVPEGITVREFQNLLTERYPELGTLAQRSVFARNEVFAGWDEILQAGDELAIIPPVSGG